MNNLPMDHNAMGGEGPAAEPRRRWLRQAAGVAAGLACMASAPWAHAQQIPPLGVPLRLPNELPLVPGPGTAQGARYGEAQARGKVLVVYWWATWCPFCAVQTPRINALWQAHRAQGLELIALSIDKSEATVREYLQQKDYRFPVAMYAGETAQVLPKARGIPVTAVRGRDGRIVFSEAGELFPEDIAGFAKFL